MAGVSLVKLSWDEHHWTQLVKSQHWSVGVIAWCHLAANLSLSQCWPISMSSYASKRPWWVNSLRPSDAILDPWIWINISSSYDLLPDSNNPSPQTMLIYHRWGEVAFTSGWFPQRFLSHQSLKLRDYFGCGFGQWEKALHTATSSD